MPASQTPVVLASGRIGRQIAINRSDCPVFLDQQGVAVCRHGERATSIMSWIAQERKDPDFIRNTSCDCENIDGLLTEYPKLEADASLELPLYQLLAEVGAEQKMVNTRPQRKALTTRDSEIWVQPNGTLVCTHGNTRKTLAKMSKGMKGGFKRKSTKVCDCRLSVPRRVGSIFVVKPESDGPPASASSEDSE